jgi:transcriptional regulator with XRE-family HTH domain
VSTEKSEVFTERLIRLRDTRKKSDFARFLGLKPQVYQRYEEGRVPRHDILSVIAARCGVTVDWLLGQEHMRNAPVVSMLDIVAKEHGDGYEIPTKLFDDAAIRGALEASLAAGDYKVAAGLCLELHHRKRQNNEGSAT